MDKADTAFMLVSAALVLLMTPALAFFYGGLVRSKNALNTMMMSFIALGFIGVLWAVIGYSLAFAPGNNWIGDTSRVFLRGVGVEPQGTIPHLLFMCYQGTFAIITAALISGAIVERMRFSAYLAFICLWALVVYSPVAHWVWGGGWLADMGALDFAGGTVVHVNAGVAALVAALCVGKRSDYPSSALLPHNVPFTLLGAGLLWFGWFGFNAGSALGATGSAALAFTTTMLAPAGTLVVWTLLDLMRQKKSTAVGAATAIVVGLVAVTPAAGFIGPMSAIALGGIAAVPSYFALIWRTSTRLDDSLDVVAAHGVGGTVGALLTGVFAQKALNGVADGLLFGNPRQLGIQAVAVAAAIVYSGVMSFVLLKLICAGGAAPRRARMTRPPASTSRSTARKRTSTRATSRDVLTCQRWTTASRRTRRRLRRRRTELQDGRLRVRSFPSLALRARRPLSSPIPAGDVRIRPMNAGHSRARLLPISRGATLAPSVTSAMCHAGLLCAGSSPSRWPRRTAAVQLGLVRLREAPPEGRAPHRSVNRKGRIHQCPRTAQHVSRLTGAPRRTCRWRSMGSGSPTRRPLHRSRPCGWTCSGWRSSRGNPCRPGPLP